MYINSNIKALRKGRGWTQQRLAEELDKTYITVGDYERGKIHPSLPVIVRLCEVFGITLDQLVLHDLSKGGPKPKPEKQLKALEEELRALQQLNLLQTQRLNELEREIRERAPELAKRLGLG